MPTIDRTTLADATIRATAVVTVSGLTLIAARTSYQHMLLLAQRHGVVGIDAHSFPLTVDGLDVIGVLVLLADRRTGRHPGTIPWLVLAIGTLASLAANIAVAPANLIARAISGWTAIALLAAAKMLSHLFEPAEASKLAVRTPAEATTSTRPQNDDRTDALLPAPPMSLREPSQPPSDIARRLPTSPAALARWRAIWAADRTEATASAAHAATHAISLRTLQFIRAAGEAGYLDGAVPGSSSTDTAEPNHHGTLTILPR